MVLVGIGTSTSHVVPPIDYLYQVRRDGYHSLPYTLIVPILVCLVPLYLVSYFL